MSINWPVIIFLVSVSLPGILIFVPRLIRFLLKNNSADLKHRISRIAITQSIVMVFVMSLTGSLLSPATSLKAPIINPMLQGQNTSSSLIEGIFPVIFITMMGLLFYYAIQRLVTQRLISPHNQTIMTRLRLATQLDGNILYYGVIDEVIGRWGLLNVIVFFGFMLIGDENFSVVYFSILISSLLLALSKLPIYISSGCQASRPFFYAVTILHSTQSVLFAYVFLHFGLLFSIVSHMLFIAGLWVVDKPEIRDE